MLFSFSTQCSSLSRSKSHFPNHAGRQSHFRVPLPWETAISQDTLRPHCPKTAKRTAFKGGEHSPFFRLPPAASGFFFLHAAAILVFSFAPTNTSPHEKTHSQHLAAQGQPNHRLILFNAIRGKLTIIGGTFSYSLVFFLLFFLFSFF